jgi:hypothetical protein
VFFWAQISPFIDKEILIYYFSSGHSIYFLKKKIFKFLILKNEKKTLLSAKYILNSNKKKRKEKNPLALGFLPLWCSSLILLPTFASFLMMSIYIYRQGL